MNLDCLIYTLTVLYMINTASLTSDAESNYRGTSLSLPSEDHHMNLCIVLL